MQLVQRMITSVKPSATDITSSYTCKVSSWQVTQSSSSALSSISSKKANSSGSIKQGSKAKQDRGLLNK
jgi:hypothetical protein